MTPVAALAACLATTSCLLPFDESLLGRRDGDPDGDPDADLDGDPDGDPDADGELAAPRPLWPWNGATTGSVHAATGGGGEPPLRPVFGWRPVAGASRYELQVSHGCSSPGFRDCPFDDGLEVDLSVSGTEHRPPEDLPVSRSQPVGRRYYWRVRACRDDGCQPWSAATVRYVDVGRLSNDFDGDGYSDVIVAAPQLDANAGAAFVHHGPELEVGPRRLAADAPHENRFFGSAVASLGDVDGDGFCDAAVGAAKHRNADGTFGAVFVYRGAPGGLETSPALVITHPDSDQDNESFGDSLSSAGDVDGDGFPELLVGARNWNHDGLVDDGAAYVYRVSADWSGFELASSLPDPAPEADSQFGNAVSTLGDVDGDGFSDLVVGAPLHDSANVNAGAAFLYRGSADGVVELFATIHSNTHFGWNALRFGHDVAGAGDLDGDGLGDILVGAPFYQSDNRGQASILGTGAWTDAGEPLYVYTVDGLASNERLGYSVSRAGDIDGDGTEELIIGSRFVSETRVGSVTVVAWIEDDPFIRRSAPLPCPTMEEGSLFGLVVAGVGDVDGDGLADVAVGAPLHDGTAVDEGAVFVFFGSGGGLDGDSAFLMLPNPDGQALSWFGKSISRVVF